MTLLDILTQAMTELNRTTDAQQMEAWRGKLVPYINAGMRDLAHYLQLRRTDTTEAVDGTILVSDLPHPCLKVVSVKQNGKDVLFNLGAFSDRIRVDGDGAMAVEYRYVPKDIKNDSDKPGIPEYLHPLLVTYTVYRDHLTDDPNMQRRAGGFQQIYETEKRELRKTLGERDTYNIINAGW